MFLFFTVNWVCGQRLEKDDHIIPDKESRLQIDLQAVTLVEGVTTQSSDETSFQVEYSLDNVTWVSVSKKRSPDGEPQVNVSIIEITKLVCQCYTCTLS